MMKASQVAKSSGSLRKSVDAINQSAEYWGLNGDLEKRGETIAKAAKEVAHLPPLHHPLITLS
jgi:hypothetical protein